MSNGSLSNSKRLCSFFIEGKCKLGDACRFRHGTANIQADETHAPRSWSSEDRRPAARVCKYFLQGHCKKGAACSFPHESADDQEFEGWPSDWTFSGPNDQDATKTCEFFEQGNCTEGDACPFQHEKPLDPWSSWGWDEVCRDTHAYLF